MLTILLLCGANLAINANQDPHAAPKWKATDANHCKGCVGIQGPCISGRWQRMSIGANAPHGILFCTYFADNGRCPRGFKACFKHAKTYRAHHHSYLHASTRLRAHAQRNGRGREETALQLMNGGAAAGAAAGGRGQSDRIAALKTQLQILKLQHQLEALGNTESPAGNV